MAELTSFFSAKSELRKSKNTFLDYFCTFSFVLSIFFNQYPSFVSGITLGEILLVLSCVLLLVKNGFRLKSHITKVALLYYLFCLLLTLFSIVVSSTPYLITSRTILVSRWIRYFAYILFFVIYLENYQSKELLLNTYRLFVLLISFYTLVQFLVYRGFGIMLPVNILPIGFSRGISADILVENAEKYSQMRAYGIFVEPSYLVKFILPGFFLSMVGWRKKHFHFVDFIIILGAIIVSKSSQGYMIAFLCGLSWLLFFNNKNAGLFIRKALLLLFFVALFAVLLRLNLFGNAISRIVNIIDGNADLSAKMRIFRGFAIFGFIPLFFKLFGVGLGNSANFVYNYNIVTQYDSYQTTDTAMEYMSGFSRILVESGFLSMVLFVFLIVVLFKKVNSIGRFLLLQFVLLLLSGSALFSIDAVFYLFLICFLGLKSKEVFNKKFALFRE